MNTDEADSWIPIAEAVLLIASGSGCTEVEARRRLANRFQDREFRLAADRVVSQLPAADYVASVMFGDILPMPIRPMERTVDECIQLTPPMFPPGALDPDSPLWTGEASFAVPHKGPLARASYYGVRVRLSAIKEQFPETANAALLATAKDMPYSGTEISDWIDSHPEYSGMKKARNAFMKEDRSRGLSATFEHKWREMRPNPVGRPRKGKMAN